MRRLDANVGRYLIDMDRETDLERQHMVLHGWRVMLHRCASGEWQKNVAHGLGNFMHHAKGQAGAAIGQPGQGRIQVGIVTCGVPISGHPDGESPWSAQFSCCVDFHS